LAIQKSLRDIASTVPTDTKFKETRPAAFLEDRMIRGSMAARKIDLEEKRVFVPTPMTQEPYFSLHVVAAPI
jgi:hypothetical protein